MEPGTPKTPDRATVWAGLATNLAMFPGLGSLLAGSRSGLAQALLTLVADLTLFCLWVFWYIHKGMIDHDWDMSWGPHKGWVILALVLRAISWIWSTTTSVRMIRSKGEASKALPPVLSPSHEDSTGHPR